MKITTDNKFRDLVSWNDLPAKAQKEFDYIGEADADDLRFVCYKGGSERVMCALNEILNGHGIESLVPTDSDRPSYDYVNMGDTYNVTILMRDDGKFIVTCWGDIVEKHMNWYA